MLDFISDYKNPNGERFNMKLMNREYDDSLVEYIVASCKSLEVLESIKFLGFKYEEDETKINLNKYFSSRAAKKDEELKYREMYPSRYGELELKFRIDYNGDTSYVTKHLLVPSSDEENYFTITGKKYFMLYQLVDSSTYTRPKTLTLKSLMPVNLQRVAKKFTDSEGTEHIAPIYTVMVFKNNINIFSFYLAKYGVSKTFEYFSIDKLMRFVDANENDPDAIYFPISSKIKLGVNKQFFNKHQYVQSCVFMMLDLVTNRLTFDKLDDLEYWTSRLGASRGKGNNYDEYARGLSTLTFFERMLDETTKKILKVYNPNKQSIYSVIRWMLQNYNELRKKDNLDLKNKRLRCNEYIASLLTKEFSDRLTRIIALGNKMTMDKIKEIFSFPGNILIQQLHKSGILRFDDKINDMDFYSKFRYTLKGPNSIGAKNSKSIGVKYKAIHPSYIGLIDINVCGTSDPGSSGVITPFANTNGLFFDGTHEPEDGIFDLLQETSSYFRNKELSTGGIYVDVNGDNESIDEYYKHLEKMENVMNSALIKKVRKNR